MATLRWNDRATHRVQTDNSVEAMLRKSGVSSWLETCGPTSATVAAEVTGHSVDVRLPGGGILQGEDALAVWMNDPKNVSILKAARPDIDPTAYMDNEIIQYYPKALEAVFGAHGAVQMVATWDDVVSAVRSGSAVMTHLTKPRHYLCVVNYDEAAQALIYRDPWPARTGTDGFNLKMLKAEFRANVQPSIVIVN
jgi:hypothetical protein